MKEKTIIGIMLVFFSVSSYWIGIGVCYSIMKDETHHKLFHYANIERQTPLKWDECLAEQAEIRAKRIHESGEFNHDGWEYYARKCSDEFIGENLVQNYDDFHDEFYQSHNVLMKSELHRENIENERFNKMGVGCYALTCVQFFSK